MYQKRFAAALQVQNSVADLLRATLVPELGANVAAGAAGDVQLLLVAVAAVRALPHQLAVVLDDLDLAVVAAHLAIIALGVELRVHDVVVDVPHDRQHRRNIALHIRHLHIGDGAAGAELLEVRLELELLKCIYLLSHMHMIAVRDVVLVRHARNDAEPLLQAFGELVCRALHGRSVYGIADMLRSLPLIALVVETLHDLE